MLKRTLSRGLAATALVFWLVPAASAVTIDWVTVGTPGNANDSTGFGSVAYDYAISKHEITNNQYSEFLNAVAGSSDPNGLYNNNMGSGFGGIAQSCSTTCTYSAISGRGNLPVNFVSFYDAMRFTNWIHNGQPTGAQDGSTTENGSYTITAQGVSDNSIQRNAGATAAITSEDEWYKAAYYDDITMGYFDYPAGFDAQTTCSAPTGAANHANCNAVHGDLTDVGIYLGSVSPVGTFDQGGNAREWTEGVEGLNRVVRGGSFVSNADNLASFSRFDSVLPNGEGAVIGFRISLIPEPGTGALLMLGLAGLGRWRRTRG